jgi:hypothetical protein
MEVCKEENSGFYIASPVWPKNHMKYVLDWTWVVVHMFDSNLDIMGSILYRGKMY